MQLPLSASTTPLAATEPRPLRAERLAGHDDSPRHTPATLGGLLCGPDADGAAGEGAVLARIPMPRLLETGDVADAWCSEGPFTSGRSGAVRWRHNGHWLWGAIDLDEPMGDGSGLEALSRHAYREVFDALHTTGLPHLQRVWNYLPHINAEMAGMERYRQFNAGRQQAFLDAGRDVYAGSPAACALGSQGEHLCIRFLAGRNSALPIDNPRQIPAYRYPLAYGPRSPSFSRAALTDAGAGRTALLVSGTASIVGHASVHAGDVRAQLKETLLNLQAVIEAARGRSTAQFSLADLQLTVYVRHAGDADAVRAGLAEALGTASADDAVYVNAEICRAELLVEIEAHAFAPGRLID